MKQIQRSSSTLANTIHSPRAVPKHTQNNYTVATQFPEALEAQRLIAIYNMPFERQALREDAAGAVVQLGNRYSAVVELIMADAREYVRMAHICDFDPYAPNSIQLLSRLDCKEKVIAFLEEIVRHDWGIPRWTAIETLCGIKDPHTDQILQGIIEGDYPPKLLDLNFDIRLIKSALSKNPVDIWRKESHQISQLRKLGRSR